MVSAEDIKNAVKDLQIHFNNHVNNKYVKNMLLRVDEPVGVSQRKDYLLKGDLYYIDSKGAIEDLFLGIMATLEYTDIISKDVVPRLAMTNADFVPTNPNERVLCQMTLKNYPTNINIFYKKLVDFFWMLLDYDNFLFPHSPAHEKVKGFETLHKICEEKRELFKVL